VSRGVKRGVLTAPSATHVQGDGILTMSKILGLKLYTDWVMLSACNTAAGNGAEALRQAEVALIDGPAYVPTARPTFATPIQPSGRP
jgi:CHAT domain-containing protein